MLILEPVIGLLGVPVWPDSVCATGTQEEENRAVLCQACALACVLMTVVIPSERCWLVVCYFCASLGRLLLLLCDFGLAVVPPAALGGCTSGGLQLFCRLTAATSYTHRAEEKGPILPPNGSASSTQAVANVFFYYCSPSRGDAAGAHRRTVNTDKYKLQERQQRWSGGECDEQMKEEHGEEEAERGVASMMHCSAISPMVRLFVTCQGPSAVQLATLTSTRSSH